MRATSAPRPDALAKYPNYPLALAFHPKLPLLYVWQDVARKQFETDHWEPLGPAVGSAVRAVDRLAVMLQQMKSDCE